jgi:hypothetical protein
LLTFTEQFDNVAWLKDNASIVSNPAVAPDGTMTADQLVENTATGLHDIYTLPATQPVGTFTYSLYVKASGRTKFRLQQTAVTAYGVFFDLVALTATSVVGGAVGSITNVGSGWYRCSLTYTTVASFAPTLALFLANDAGSISYTGDGTSGILIWGAQLEASSTATAYQRVTDRYNVTEAGVSSVSYLFFDGVNDSLATSSINFTSTDKMTVFAGVRKLSDVNGGIVVESSVNSATQNGAFGLFAPDNNGAATFGFLSRGSALAFVSVGSLSAPITRVATLLADISGDNLIGRLNGVQVGQSSADQGTGTFTNQITYIGSRAGIGAFFSGHLYSLIVRGAQSNTGQISAAEAWVANKTGVTI